MKKILFISGSARNGNCKDILEEIQQQFWLQYSTEVIFLRDYDLTHCHGCLQCRNTDNNSCIKEDKMNLVIDKIMDAEIIVLASPNYFYNVTGLTKNFIDKTVALYEKQALRGKKFMFIYTGEDKAEETKKHLDSAVLGFVECHNIENLGSFAFQTPGIHQFADEGAKTSTINEICSTLRKTIAEIDGVEIIIK